MDESTFKTNYTMNIETLVRDKDFGGYRDTHWQGELCKQFRAVIKGVNFFTNETVGFVIIKGGVAEISKGAKFLETEMWGVTTVVNNQRCIEKDKCLNSWGEVVAYINELNS